MKKLIILLAFVASAAQGEIYTWTDSRGTAHYTNGIHDVPTRYRHKVKVLDLGIEPKGAQSSPQQPSSQQPAALPSVTIRPEEVRHPGVKKRREGRRPRRSISAEHEE